MLVIFALLFFVGGGMITYFIVTSRYFVWKPFEIKLGKSLPVNSHDITFHGDERFLDTQEIKPHSADVHCWRCQRMVRVQDCPGRSNPFQVGELKGLFLSSNLQLVIGWCQTSDDVLLFRFKKHPSNPRNLHVDILTDYVPQDSILVERPRRRNLPV